MDLLTHLFLPVTVAYALRPDLFPAPQYLALAVFAVLPDFGKALPTPGLFHSVFAVGAIGAVGVLVDRRYWNRRTYAVLAVLLLASHLLLDFLDGGPVTLLFPILETGVGLTYPTQIVFGGSILDVAVYDPLPGLRVGAPDPGREQYPLVDGYGVLSAVAFLTVYLGVDSRARSSEEVEW